MGSVGTSHGHPLLPPRARLLTHNSGLWTTRPVQSLITTTKPQHASRGLDSGQVFRERDSSFEWSLPPLSPPEPVKAKWFFPSRTLRLRYLAVARGGGGVCAQVPGSSVNFLSLWLKLVSPDQQFDISPCGVIFMFPCLTCQTE